MNRELEKLRDENEGTGLEEGESGAYISGYLKALEDVVKVIKGSNVYVIINASTEEVWSDAYLEWQDAAEECQKYNEEAQNPNSFYIKTLSLE